MVVVLVVWHRHGGSPGSMAQTCFQPYNTVSGRRLQDSPIDQAHIHNLLTCFSPSVSLVVSRMCAPKLFYYSRSTCHVFLSIYVALARV